MDLTIDGKQVRMNAFVQKILTNISMSVIDSLDDVPDNPETIAITLAPDSAVDISVDGQIIRMNPFVHKTTHNIIMGMINSLDGIPENPQSVALSISKE